MRPRPTSADASTPAPTASRWTSPRAGCRLNLDPSGGLLRSFLALNNQVLDRFSVDERSRIGVHTCPGGDQDSTHSFDVDYTELLPALFGLHAGRFYVQLASEADPRRALAAIREHSTEDQSCSSG